MVHQLERERDTLVRELSQDPFYEMEHLTYLDRCLDLLHEENSKLKCQVKRREDKLNVFMGLA